METKAPNAPIEAIFAQCGPWQSRFNIDGVVLGGPYDFVADPRIARLQEEISVEGKRVLELGCLEGGHSVALSRRKPRELVAVEGRPANYVRCCVVKNLFGLDNVRFRLDDVRKVSIERYGRFDLVVAMGVLYHLPDPHVLLSNLRALSDDVYLNTHYANDRHPRNSPEAELLTPWGRHRGRRYHEYGLADPLSGLDEASFWPYFDDLLSMCGSAGFGDCKIMARDDDPAENTSSWVEIRMRASTARPDATAARELR